MSKPRETLLHCHENPATIWLSKDDGDEVAELRVYWKGAFLGCLESKRSLRRLAHAILRAIGDEPGGGK